MRIIIAVALASALLLSGCASLFAAPTTGMVHVSGMETHAEGKLDNARFLGMAAIEGTIDIDGFVAMMKEEMEEEGEDPTILDKFNFRFENGELGDGRTGAWFGIFDEPGHERYLLVQSLAGEIRSHLFDFEGETEAEADEEIQLALFAPVLKQMKAMRSTTVADECETTTHTPLGIDSDKAAKIAMAQPEFANHTIENPEADFIYIYIPEYTYCWDGETETEQAMWGVVNADVDLLLNETEPAAAYVFMNATDGEIVESGIEKPMAWTQETFMITVAGGVLFPPLGPAASNDHDVTVPVGAVEMWAWLENIDGDIEHWFIDPAGDRVDFDVFGSIAMIWLEAPAAGQWTLHSEFDHVPLESRQASAELFIISEQ